MKIKIDGKDIQVEDANKNIVEIADEHGITITAPCFRNKKRNGCCKACLIEIDGQEKYACGTKPKEGMDIVYKREDLEATRKERLKLYADNIRSGNLKNNSCGSVSPIQITTL